MDWFLYKMMHECGYSRIQDEGDEEEEGEDADDAESAQEHGCVVLDLLQPGLAVSLRGLLVPHLGDNPLLCLKVNRKKLRPAKLG